METNYKEIDMKNIINYIDSSPSTVLVENIIRNSGAEKLRVYPILFELQQSKYIEVIETDWLGAPIAIRRK